MFPLTEKTQRGICRAAFLLLCVLPTLAVSAWCARRHLPAVVEAEARKMQRELGLSVSLENLRHLRPGNVLYEGLTLADPETGQVVLRCGALEADWGQRTDKDGRPKASLVLIASQPEIEAAAARRLRRLLGRLLRRQPGRPQFEVRLSTGQLMLRAADGSQTLTQVLGRMESTEHATQVEARFRPAGSEMPQPARVRIVRNRRTAPPTTGFELDTGGGTLPCKLLAMVLPGLRRLGPRSRFRGYVWANQSTDGQAPDGWDGELAGQWFDVDLDTLVTGLLPHQLSGTAQVTVQSARFRRRRLVEAAGTLGAGPGLISRSLIDAAVGHLGLIAAGEPQAPGDLVPYERLALGFLIDSRGLHLRGAPLASAPGAILLDRQGPLLSEPVLQPRPVVALVRALVPASRLQVPATRQTEWLVRHLPLPEIVPPEVARRVRVDGRYHNLRRP